MPLSTVWCVFRVSQDREPGAFFREILIDPISIPISSRGEQPAYQHSASTTSTSLVDYRDTSPPQTLHIERSDFAWDGRDIHP